MRWDRAGVIYTKRLPFSEPDIAIFLRRLSGASREYRGCDVSVEIVTPEDGDIVNIRKALGVQGDAKLCKIGIDKNLYFIAKNQAHGSRSPIGRSTRCFEAYSKTKKEVVLLKDTWRIISPHLIPEHEIYEKLQAGQVFNLPQVYDGADVSSEGSWQETKTALMAQELKLTLNVHTLRHYRIALEYLPYTLDQFKTTKGLVSALRDAAQTHREAVEKADILHRDISVGNIMMKEVEGVMRGYLIDWDLSLDGTKAGVENEHTGTWQFLAVRLFEKTKDGAVPIQNRIDDVESFFHVATWIALRHTSHGLTPQALKTILNSNFDASVHIDGRILATEARRFNMMTGALIRDAEFKNRGISAVLEGMSLTLRERYTSTREPEGDDKRLSVWKVNNQYRLDVLEELEDPQWLENLLRQFLDAEKIDWRTQGGRKHNNIPEISASGRHFWQA
ncbi:hypothetical protein C0991_005920 [Blastosporella zonata]|nr:hypothetical protein C0991_005920 [Blastosporella zonata]